MYTTLLVFDDCLLVEQIPASQNPFSRHMETALAFLGEPGFLGSSLIPPGNEIPSLAQLVSILNQA